MAAQDIPDAVKRATGYKDQANMLFKEGKLDAAITKYQETADIFRSFGDTCIGRESNQILVAVNSNSAQAYLQLATENNELEGRTKDSLYESALQSAEKALSIDSTNVKARFRRGCAFEGSEEYIMARKDFEWVAKMEPKDAKAKQALWSIKQKIKTSKQDKGDSMQKGFAKAFDERMIKDTRGWAAPGSQGQACDRQVEEHIAGAEQHEKGAIKYLTALGCPQMWYEREERIRRETKELTEKFLKMVEEIENDGLDLKEEMGKEERGGKKRYEYLGEILRPMNEEQRRKYIEAEAKLETINRRFGTEVEGISATGRNECNCAPPV